MRSPDTDGKGRIERRRPAARLNATDPLQSSDGLTIERRIDPYLHLYSLLRHCALPRHTLPGDPSTFLLPSNNPQISL